MQDEPGIYIPLCLFLWIPEINKSSFFDSVLVIYIFSKTLVKCKSQAPTTPGPGIYTIYRSSFVCKKTILNCWSFSCIELIVLRSNNLLPKRSRIPDKWICTSYILIPVINSGGFEWGIYKNMIIFLIGIDNMNKSHWVCFIINWYQFSIWFFHNMK